MIIAIFYLEYVTSDTARKPLAGRLTESSPYKKRDRGTCGERSSKNRPSWGQSADKTATSTDV